jgi:hypothetical protein
MTQEERKIYMKEYREKNKDYYKNYSKEYYYSKKEWESLETINFVKSYLQLNSIVLNDEQIKKLIKVFKILNKK